jgi:hypothetical protein
MGPDRPPYRERLQATRRALLDLHKLLLNRQRAEYQQDHGPLTNAGLFDLAMNDPAFAWLQPVLQIVVQIDEMLEWNDLWNDEDAGRVLDRTRALLKASETGTPFEQKYDAALQAEPDIVFAHRAVIEAAQGKG